MKIKCVWESDNMEKGFFSITLIFIIFALFFLTFALKEIDINSNYIGNDNIRYIALQSEEAYINLDKNTAKNMLNLAGNDCNVYKDFDNLNLKIGIKNCKISNNNIQKINLDENTTDVNFTFYVNCKYNTNKNEVSKTQIFKYFKQIKRNLIKKTCSIYDLDNTTKYNQISKSIN